MNYLRVLEMYETIYYLVVNMRELPENIPMDVNPRVPKMETNVAKRLIQDVYKRQGIYSRLFSNGRISGLEM